MRSVEVGTAARNEGAPRRSVKSPKSLVSRPQEDVKTVYDVLVRGARVFGSRKIMGSRKLIREVVEKKEHVKVIDGEERRESKEWSFVELSPFEWITFSEVHDIATHIGSGFRTLGLNAGDKVTLFASTSRDWMLTALACYTQSLTITTAYDTLGADGLTFSLNEGEISTLFTDGVLMDVVNHIAAKVPTLKNVIYNGAPHDGILDSIRASHPHLNVLSLPELRALGEKNKHEHVPPSPEDVSCIMYTSGSTGNPKGVILTHENIVAAVAGARLWISGHIASHAEGEVYLAYLPLAHVLEFVAENLFLYEGVAIGYGSPRTLTDSSVRNCLGDIRELRPTVMTGVPAVWETIAKGISAKIREMSPISKRVFETAFDLKWRLIQNGMPTGIVDRVVFDSIGAQVGGRLKFALSGGAPIPKSTHKFLSVCICPIVSGYGMTETCGIISVQNIDQFGKLGVVGPPCASGEVKLVDVPELNYLSRNKPNPQGEIWIRGPTVMKGYYKQPKVTKENLTEDGWLMTGDIGEWTPDGNLAVIDRKKNLVKLAHGEYIALEKLESLYKTSPFVQNVLLYADSEQPFCVAIVTPIITEMVHYLKKTSQEVQSQELAELARHPQVRKAVFASLRDVAKKFNLKPAEIIGAAFVAGEEWTPQNGLLTAAQKLKRKEIVERYRDEIKKMYSAPKASL